MIFCDISKGRPVSGGIGNCLFKIAACLSLAKQNNADYLLSEWSYDIFENLRFENKRENLEINHNHCESGFEFSPIVFSKNMEITGYFQSEKYFNDREFILKSFSFKKDISEYIVNKYGDIINGNTSSIHIRRGDYLSNGNYEILSKSYYNKAIEMMKEEGVERFVIFSDDIRWCRNNFAGENLFFVEGEKDYIDLFLMSMCKNNIIANSSFSWWGAWLNKSANKIIISPKVWFRAPLGHLNTRDLIPEEWIKI